MEALRTQTGVFTAVLHHTGGTILTGLLLRAHGQIFITEAPPPSRLTAALPWLLTGTVQAARHHYTALTTLAIPARVTPADSRLITAAVGDITAAVTSLTCAGWDDEDAAAQQDDSSSD